MPVRSQTWRDLRRLLEELPSNRIRFLVVVLLASFLQGLMDILLVGLLARLVGLAVSSFSTVRYRAFARHLGTSY